LLVAYFFILFVLSTALEACETFL